MNLRDENGRVKGNVIIATVFAAMLVAMVPAVMAIATTTRVASQAEAAGAMDRPYVKAFAGGKAIYEPNAGILQPEVNAMESRSRPSRPVQYEDERPLLRRSRTPVWSAASAAVGLSPSRPERVPYALGQGHDDPLGSAH